MEAKPTRQMILPVSHPIDDLQLAMETLTAGSWERIFARRRVETRFGFASSCSGSGYRCCWISVMHLDIKCPRFRRLLAGNRKLLQRVVDMRKRLSKDCIRPDNCMYWRFLYIEFSIVMIMLATYAALALRKSTFETS